VFDHDQVLNENGSEVSVSVRNAKKTDDDGYLNLNFNEGKFENIPNIKAWCVDLGRSIKKGDYQMDVLSSLDVNATDTDYGVYTDAVDKPEYLPSINWLFNNHPSGSTITIPNCTDYHDITDQEFQLAVWGLVDNHTNPDQYWKNEEDECVVEHLKDEAKLHMDFEPNCSDPEALIGLIVIVDDDETGEVLKQTLVAEIKLRESGVCDCTAGAAVFGDPHFKTWAGEYYDFHGVCDLMLIKNPEFENRLGMDIHVRSTRMGVWSYISSAAIRIGDDILEIAGGQGEKKFWINGALGENIEINDSGHGTKLTSTLSGYPIIFRQLNKKQREFVVELGKGDKIVFTTWNAFVGVHFKKPNEEHFQKSVGLMGSFPEGLKLARDNTSVIDELDVFGQEWQVLASEPKLFHNIEGPQHPIGCEIPRYSEMRRRLGESTTTIEEARKACANLNVDVMDLCVFDVMATGDESIVGAY
jgi:hypothetical protein